MSCLRAGAKGADDESESDVKTIESDLTTLQRDGVWLLVWRDSIEVHRTMFRDQAAAEAYAAKHGGVLVRLWPHQEPSQPQP